MLLTGPSAHHTAGPRSLVRLGHSSDSLPSRGLCARKTEEGQGGGGSRLDTAARNAARLQTVPEGPACPPVSGVGGGHAEWSARPVLTPAHLSALSSLRPAATTCWRTGLGTSTAWSATPACWRPPTPRNVSVCAPAVVPAQLRYLALHGSFPPWLVTDRESTEMICTLAAGCSRSMGRGRVAVAEPRVRCRSAPVQDLCEPQFSHP